MRKLKGYIFNLIRKMFWKDYHPDEDFICMECGNPVFRRFLFCSTKCNDKFNEKYGNCEAVHKASVQEVT